MVNIILHHFLEVLVLMLPQCHRLIEYFHQIHQFFYSPLGSHQLSPLSWLKLVPSVKNLFCILIFDREIDRWMTPESRLKTLDENFSLETVLEEYLPQGVSRWEIVYPSERDKVLRLFYAGADGYQRIDINPATYERLSYTETAAATGFIYPFHYHLMLPETIGIWIVAFASMLMLALLVSGVVIHKKILVDFFTFRPRKKLTRSSLDLHNITGVMGLPFHFAITISGLILFQNYYAAPVMHRIYGSDLFAFSPPAAYSSEVAAVSYTHLTLPTSDLV